jgi:hypothetical protein
MNESVKLDAVCDRCGLHLELIEGSECHLIGCVACDADAGQGATPADALEHWYQNNPVAVQLSPLASFVPERQPWFIECDGYPFNTLSEAEAYANGTGAAIFCRLTRNQKAANQ